MREAAAMAEIKWVKLNTDMFDNRKIKHLRRLPEGNNIVLIWIMLLTMAGRCNSGGMIFLTENIPYTTKMLADELDFEENTVQLALRALEQLGMISTHDNFFSIAGWQEHQNIEGMEKIREQNRIRKQRQREKAALPAPPEPCHVTSRDSHATDKDIDIDKDKDKDKDKDNIPYISIVEYLNQKAGTRYKASGAKTKAAIHARFSEGFTEEDFRTVIDKKCAEWIGTEWEKFLRPETLFGTKFESYLNAKVTKGKQQTAEKQHTQTDDFMDQLRAMYNPGGN
jgi:predicted phage replisome organizer/uncharacterized phage protein (TIGR02220 family)